MSHDLEDIINVIEGRVSIVEEISASEQPVRAYLADRFADLAANSDFRNVLPGLVAYDDLHSLRVGSVMKKIQTIAAPILP
jgi:hypothetical protein